MKYAFCLTLSASFAVFAGNLKLDAPVLADPTGLMLQYDDGTGWWVTWTGLYRGVWFNTADFYGSANICPADEAEFWFYHDSGYPWDTSSFYSELYDGGVAGPETELDETSLVATHNSAVLLDYRPAITCDVEFWLFVNTEFSSGNWPSVLGDNTPHNVDHSFHSDDTIVWEPWIVQGPNANDYLIRMDVIVCDLESETWGSIKSLF